MTGNKKLIYAALFAALCCVITMYPKFPTLFGYIHAGDALVLLAAYVLGPLWGSLAAALGSSLADLMAGYVQYFPGGCCAASGPGGPSSPPCSRVSPPSA